MKVTWLNFYRTSSLLATLKARLTIRLHLKLYNCKREMWYIFLLMALPISLVEKKAKNILKRNSVKHLFHLPILNLANNKINLIQFLKTGRAAWIKPTTFALWA